MAKGGRIPPLTVCCLGRRWDLSEIFFHADSTPWFEQGWARSPPWALATNPELGSHIYSDNYGNVSSEIITGLVIFWQNTLIMYCPECCVHKCAFLHNLYGSWVGLAPVLCGRIHQPIWWYMFNVIFMWHCSYVCCCMHQLGLVTWSQVSMISSELVWLARVFFQVISCLSCPEDLFMIFYLKRFHHTISIKNSENDIKFQH